MATKEQKDAVHKLIDDADDGFLNLVREAAAFYYSGESQQELDAGILEAEEDIKTGRTYSLSEVREMSKKRCV